MPRTRLLLRLEPQDGTDLGGALAPRVWDPPWTLARPYQMGELLATVAGSPVACPARAPPPLPGWPLPTRLAAADAQRGAAVRDAAEAWIRWCDATLQEPVLPSSWSTTRLTHQLTAAAASSDSDAGTAVFAVTHDGE